MKYIFLILILLSIPLGNSLLILQHADATGGGKDIASLIQPMIDRATQYIQEGNTDAALEELQTIQEELKDTFELED